MRSAVVEDMRVLKYLTEARRTGRLREIREAVGLSTLDIARACRVHQTTVSGWERGNKPSGDAALRYAAALLILDPQAPRDLVKALSRT